MKKTIKTIILFGGLYYLHFNNIYAEESNQISNIPKKNISNKYSEKWGILVHVGFGPTLSSFCSCYNKSMDDYFPNKNFGKLKRRNFKIYKGLSFSFECGVGYKTLYWLENQIYYKSQNSTIYTGREKGRYYSIFKGSLSSAIGTNTLFYINENLFVLTGIGVKFNTDKELLNIIPVLNLGFGFCTDFGLIFKLTTNLTFDLLSLKDDYINALKKGEKFEKIDEEDLNTLNSTLSLDIIQISIGYRF